jgi:predicted transcriptional regulator
MKKLTKAEEEIMQVLWEQGSGFVKDIQAKLDKNPAYNTVSTIVRILEDKGFVGHEPQGRAHEYFPMISKEAYKREFMKGFLNNYFRNSWKEMVSFFNKNEDIDLAELEEMQAMIQSEINKKRRHDS